jgi:hypothetical protein
LYKKCKPIMTYTNFSALPLKGAFFSMPLDGIKLSTPEILSFIPIPPCGVLFSVPPCGVLRTKKARRNLLAHPADKPNQLIPTTIISR